jgi:hypothetical protein
MSWIQQNKLPAAILGVTGIGFLGLGYGLFSAWSNASAKQEEFDSVNASLATLKKAPLAPTQENLTLKAGLVQAYEAEVTKLSNVLYGLQAKDQPLTNTQFQAKLKEKVAAIKKLGTGRLPAEFNLGFDKYASELPKSDQVASELSGYLDSVDEVVKMLLNKDVKAIETFQREELDSESDKPAESASVKAASKAKASPKGKGGARGTAAKEPEGPKIAERRKLTFVIRADQSALQAVMSALASPSEMPYFTAVRILRIENEQQVGPLRVAAGSVAPSDGSASVSLPTESVTNAPAGQENKPKPIAVIQPAAPDSQVVMGRELLRAYLEVDLVKFLNPNAPAASTGAN